ncbi:DHH family protein [Delphinella strobiligena]|nr:DHH family protein [Delphinella strobiligena]
MKRKNRSLENPSAPKRARPELPEYHATPPVRDENGVVVWPAPDSQIEQARAMILDCAKAQKRTLIVPDKDADGLSSGVILRRTLELLGLSPDLITVHLISKGTNVHSEIEREQMKAVSPAFIFVLDQGSRRSEPLIDGPHKGLVIDHHYAASAADFPKGADFVTACNSPPVATSSLLTYEICKSLHPGVAEHCAWLCVTGTHGDLGNTLKWEPPFPDMKATFKQYTKKTLNEVVSYINAPRRTATYDVSSAWDALVSAQHPSEVLTHPRLLAARQEVNAEVERCTHAAPKFSADGKVAVFRISSEAQVHPVIATRWAGHLQSKALEIVLVANEGYLPGKINFSCRIARCARGRDVPVSIIESLKAYAMTAPETEEDVNGSETSLLEKLGDNFARGHAQASGGIVDVAEFEELMRLMRVGEKAEKKTGSTASPSKGSKKTAGEPNQKNTLMNYFKQK